jgi:hypothetical protein
MLQVEICVPILPSGVQAQVACPQAQGTETTKKARVAAAARITSARSQNGINPSQLASQVSLLSPKTVMLHDVCEASSSCMQASGQGTTQVYNLGTQEDARKWDLLGQM